MAIQQQGVRKSRVKGVSLAMGLLMPVSILLAENRLAVDVPLDPDGVQRAVVEADSYEFIPQHLVVNESQETGRIDRQEHDLGRTSQCHHRRSSIRTEDPGRGSSRGKPDNQVHPHGPGFIRDLLR
jgi:hypothetical protein